MAEPQRIPATPRPRWYRPTPGRLLVGLLPVEGLLFLSEHFRWFGFNEHKGWTALIGLAVVVVGLALILLWYAVSLVFRLRFQFSLRSLLLLVVVVALPCSWLASEMQAAKRQSDALRFLRKYENRISYDYDLKKSGLPRPEWLRNRLGIDFVADVRFVCLQVDETFTYADMVHIAALPKLQVLMFGGAEITDAGITHLRGLMGLQKLSLFGTAISDNGLVVCPL